MAHYAAADTYPVASPYLQSDWCEGFRELTSLGMAWSTCTCSCYMNVDWDGQNEGRLINVQFLHRFVQRLHNNTTLTVSEQSEMVQDFYGVRCDMYLDSWVNTACILNVLINSTICSLFNNSFLSSFPLATPSLSSCFLLCFSPSFLFPPSCLWIWFSCIKSTYKTLMS